MTKEDRDIVDECIRHCEYVAECTKGILQYVVDNGYSKEILKGSIDYLHKMIERRE